MISTRASHLREWSQRGNRRDYLAIIFIVVLALCYLAPALSSGPSFGPADLGRGLSSLTSIAHPQVHNNINGDIIDQSVAWNTLNYTLIHHGQFPLWNVYAGNGLPQFLNFESGVLALPSLVGYLVPLSWSFTVIVLVKLLIAGLGTYWAARLLRLGALPATFAATSFMLSGAFANWLGWSISGVLCWAGVIFAGAILCYRARTATAPIAVLGFSVAFAIYGGFPEGYALLAGTFVILLGVVAVLAWSGGRRLGLRTCARFGTGGLLGLGLSAPLWLPGLAVVRASIRAGTDTSQGLPIHGILLALAQGYDGLPTAGDAFFLGRTNYFESAAYIGIIGLVFAGIAVGTRVFWRKTRSPVVVGLTITAIVQVLVIYQFGSHSPVQHLIRAVGLGSISTHRLLPLLAFVLALLGAYGVRELLDPVNARRRDMAFVTSAGVVAVVLGYMWLTVPDVAQTSCVAPSGGNLPSATCEAIRRSSLYGPTVLVVVLGCIALVAFRSRIATTLHLRDSVPAVGESPAGPSPIGSSSSGSISSRYAPTLIGVLVVIQSCVLLFAGVEINTYSATDYPSTPAVTALATLTKGALVAQDGSNVICPTPIVGVCGVRQPTGIDLYPNINIGYGIDELGMHDPIIPKKSFTTWPVPDAGQLLAATNLFNPDVDSVTLARDYGVAFVLAPATTKAPAGMAHVARLTNNGVSLSLYRVPDSAKVMASHGARVVSISNSGDRQVVVKLIGHGSTTVTAHITDSPGWHASINGVGLAIVAGSTNDLVVHVPASALALGHGTLTFSYLPRNLILGLAFAVVSLVLFVAIWLVERRRRTKMSGKSASIDAMSW